MSSYIPTTPSQAMSGEPHLDDLWEPTGVPLDAETPIRDILLDLVARVRRLENIEYHRD